jgi:hypothetical protein
MVRKGAILIQRSFPLILIHPSSIAHSFVNQYAKPIEDGRHKNASPRIMQIAEKANDDLQLKLRPYFLQRMKQDFLMEQLPMRSVNW